MTIDDDIIGFKYERMKDAELIVAAYPDGMPEKLHIALVRRCIEAEKAKQPEAGDEIK